MPEGVGERKKTKGKKRKKGDGEHSEQIKQKAERAAFMLYAQGSLHRPVQRH